MMSIVEIAPEIVSQPRRYPTYFGAPWSKEGGLWERSSLTGDWGGTRANLIDSGIFFDVGLTQVFQSNVAGGKKTTNSLRYSGSLDYWLSFDTAKLGLWSGGLWVINAETSIGRSANGDVGSVLPVNFDAIMPVFNEESGKTTVSELYLLQTLGPEISVLLGKANGAGFADNNRYANNERTQFLYTGLVNNALIGQFAPYTAMTAAVVWQPAKSSTLTLAAWDADGKATTSGFDTMFDGATAVALEWDINDVELFAPGLKGTLRFGTVMLFENGLADLSVNSRTFIGQLQGLIPLETVNNNIVFYANFDHQIHVVDEETGEGWGVFGRIGLADPTRSVLDQFYSLGVGGRGGLSGRHNDTWGVGWAATHISSDFQDNLGAAGIDINSMEHAIEMFYSFELTPALHLTPDIQFIVNPAGGDSNTFTDDDYAVVVGLRLQASF